MVFKSGVGRLKRMCILNYNRLARFLFKMFTIYTLTSHISQCPFPHVCLTNNECMTLFKFYIHRRKILNDHKNRSSGFSLN